MGLRHRFIAFVFRNDPCTFLIFFGSIIRNKHTQNTTKTYFEISHTHAYIRQTIRFIIPIHKYLRIYRINTKISLTESRKQIISIVLNN